MQHPNYLKEKTTHGTANLPVALHKLVYTQEEDHYFGLHWHDELELVYVLEGGMVYTLEDKDYPLLAGQGLFINANQLHGAKSYGSLACVAMVVVFHPQFFGSPDQPSNFTHYVQPILIGDRIIEPLLSKKILWQKHILDTIQAMEAHLQGRVQTFDLLLRSQLYGIWHHLFENSQIITKKLLQENGYKSDRLKPLLRYIQDHYAENLNLDTLAAMIPISKSQLCKSFKEIVGMSPIAYLIRYRIQRSCVLLKESNLSVSSISRNVGFDNVSYFNREFLKANGMSPLAYKKKEATNQLGILS